MANAALDPHMEQVALTSIALQIEDCVAILVRQRVKVSDEDLAAALRTATGRPEIELDRRPSGRPCLKPPFEELGVSIARRSALTIAGFSPTRAVGVDVEICDAAVDPVLLSRDHFAAGEAALVAAENRPGAFDLFLRLWCAKEAILKAGGRGIFDGLAEPDLSGIADVLKMDCAVAAWTSSPPAPDGRVTVRRLADTDAYIALAVLQ